MLAKRETNCYKIRVVIDGMNDMRALVGAAGTGASTGGTDMINVEVKKYHFRLFCFWQSGA
jgi:fructose-1,6-bisphosphatase